MMDTSSTAEDNQWGRAGVVDTIHLAASTLVNGQAEAVSLASNQTHPSEQQSADESQQQPHTARIRLGGGARGGDELPIASEEIPRVEQEDSESGGLKRKCVWTPERTKELKQLVLAQGRTNLSRQSSNFWRDLTQRSQTLRDFSKGAVRMKARRMGLLVEDSQAWSPPSDSGALYGLANDAELMPQDQPEGEVHPSDSGQRVDLPSKAQHDVIDALLERGLSSKQIQQLSQTHNRSSADLNRWLQSTLQGLKSMSGLPPVASRALTCAAPEADSGGQGTEPASGSVKSLWTAACVVELRQLVTRAEETQATATAGLKNNFWRDLPEKSRLLAGFSKEALRMKARRMGLALGRADSEQSDGEQVGWGDGDGNSFCRGRWSAEQMQELKELLKVMQPEPGGELAHERGFWVKLRNSSTLLHGFSNESIRMKARRMLDAHTEEERPKEASTCAGIIKPKWTTEAEAELKNLLALRHEAGVQSSRNGFWVDLVNSSSKLRDFKPDTIRKRCVALQQKGLLAEYATIFDAGVDKSKRQMPLNVAQVKELQQLIAGRLAVDAYPKDNLAWEELKTLSRTLKAFPTAVLRDRGERLKAFDETVPSPSPP